MNRNISIKLKAAFLLTVFALNTAVGFACSVGVDMGFNSNHHHNEEAKAALVHVHKDGKRHDHKEKKENHNSNESNHHNQVNSNQKSGNDKDGCCNDEVRKFEQLDKSIPHGLNIIHPVFFTASLSTIYKINLLLLSDVVIDTKPHFVRSDHPPISDIRIVIQSFQI